MLLSQNWVGYLDRSYEQIKRSLLSRLTVEVPEISDHSESNPFIIIISMFSGIAEMLNLYIDNVAKESYIGTAKKYTSVVRLARLLDYAVKSRNPAGVNLTFSLVNSAGALTPYSGGDIQIPIGTIISTSSGVIFRTLKTAYIKSGKTQVVVGALQIEPQEPEILGVTNGTPNQEFVLKYNYAYNTIKVSIAGVIYTRRNSLGQLGITERGFCVLVKEDGLPYLIFGDSIKNGLIPPSNEDINIEYSITDGNIGNVPPNTITNLITTLTLPSPYLLKVSNLDYASGGTETENIEEIRNRAPRSIRTLDRAVTYQDYIDICLQVPGVGSAELKYCCGKFIDLYIAPSTPGAASIPLLEAVKLFIDYRKMIGTFVDVKASGVSKIWIKGTVYGKPLLTQTEVQLQIAKALDDEYGYNKIQINRKVVASDIIALIENQNKVDRFELSEIRILPYTRAIENTITPLNIEFLSLPDTATTYKYTVVFNNNNKFEIYRDATLITELDISTALNDMGYISFKINTGSYVVGDKWEFTVFKSYPKIFPSTLIPIVDFSAPIIEVSEFIDNNTQRTIYGNITVIAQNILSTSLPPCN